MSLQIRTNTLTSGLKTAAAKIADKRPILEAMGTQLTTMTQLAFRDSALRAAPWPARKDNKPHQLLRKSGALWQSIRITGLNNDSVTVGTDRVYAAVQQLGSSKSKGRGGGIPPRPFFPFNADGTMTQKAQEKIRRIGQEKIKSLLSGL